VLVVLSHLGIRFYGLNPGVFAVIIFYLLAGYVLSHLYHEIIPNTKYKLLLFYKERMLRIFPLYLYVVFLTTLFLLVSSFGNAHFTIKNTLANLTIIPLNYYMYFDFSVLSDPKWWLIPPAWSLGAELQAYLLLPLLFVVKSNYKHILILLSFALYTLANFSIVQPDYFGYRLLPGILFIFYIGIALQKKEYKTLLLLYVLTLLLLGVDLFAGSFNAAYAKETLLGILLGTPLLITFARSNKRVPLNTLLGSLSYGLFLSHFLAIWLTTYLNIDFSTKTQEAITILIVALTVAYVGVVSIEKPLKRYRIFRK